MKSLLTFALLCTAFTTHAQSPSQDFFDHRGIIAGGSKSLIKESQKFSFTEGPVADKIGNVYFTDQPNNKIWYFNVKNKSFKEFKNNAGRANGLAIDTEGNIIACADENNELWSISPNGDVKILLGKVENKQLNGPNDLWIDKNGGIYFTDPYYQRNYWTRTQPEIKKQNVYYLPKGADQPFIVSSDLVKPNGIIGTVNGKHLFVADIGDNKIYRFDITQNGSLTNKIQFASQRADGITMDEKGNLYTAGNGVTIFDNQGTKIGHIPIPEKWTANVCFAGKKRNILFITAGPSIYTLKMKVKGQKAY